MNQKDKTLDAHGGGYYLPKQEVSLALVAGGVVGVITSVLVAYMISACHPDAFRLLLYRGNLLSSFSSWQGYAFKGVIGSLYGLGLTHHFSKVKSAFIARNWAWFTLVHMVRVSVYIIGFTVLGIVVGGVLSHLMSYRSLKIVTEWLAPNSVFFPNIRELFTAWSAMFGSIVGAVAAFPFIKWFNLRALAADKQLIVEAREMQRRIAKEE